jgi:hypothetical protein
MLMAARSSQDFAFCCRATVSARSKYASAFAAFGARRLPVGYSCRCKPRHAEPPEFSTGLLVQSLVKRSIGASFFLLSHTISQSVSELSAHQNLIYESAFESSARDLSIWPRHFEHGVGTDFEVVPSAPCTRDGARQRGLVNALLDEGFINVDGHYFAQG